MPKQHIAHISARLELSSPLTPNQEAHITNNLNSLIKSAPLYGDTAYCGVQTGELRDATSTFRNTDIILAALRTLQHAIKTDSVPPGIDGIVDTTSLGADEIDALCEEVNFNGAALQHTHEMTDTREVIDWQEAEQLDEGETPEPQPRYVRKTTFNNQVMMEFYNSENTIDLGLIVEINKGKPCVHIDAGADSLLAVTADNGKLSINSDYNTVLSDFKVGYEE